MQPTSSRLLNGFDTKSSHIGSSHRAVPVPAERTPDQRRRAEGEETILVVEDDAEIRAYAVRVLRERGYYILEADNADAALTIVREQKLDLLFTDIGLPNTDGRQLSRSARRYSLRSRYCSRPATRATRSSTTERLTPMSS